MYVLNHPDDPESKTSSEHDQTVSHDDHMTTSSPSQSTGSLDAGATSSTKDGDSFWSRLMVVGQAAEGDGDAPMEIDSENPIPELNAMTKSNSGSRLEGDGHKTQESTHTTCSKF